MWEEVTLESAVVFGPKVKLQKGKPCAFIGMEDLDPNSNFVYPAKAVDFEGQGGAKFGNGHILFARITPCLQNRKIAQAKLGEYEHGFGSTEFLVFDEKPGVSDINFLLYLLKTDYVVNHAENSMVGASGRQRADWQYFKTIKIPLPPLPLQRQIAAVLGRYDALLENYQAQVVAVEGLAQELYREWFVRGRCPGAEAGPNGELPAGWEVKKLFDVATITYGFPFDSSQFNEDGEGIPVVRIRDVLNSTTKTFSPELAPEKYLLKNGDILVGMDGEFHIQKWTGGEAYLNQRVLRATPSEGIPRYFLLFAITPPIQFLNSIIVGTTVAHLGDADLRRVEIIRPDDDSLAAFAKITEPMFEKALNLQAQIITLRATRDALLPRLLSGQLLPNAIPTPV